MILGVFILVYLLSPTYILEIKFGITKVGVVLLNRFYVQN